MEIVWQLIAGIFAYKTHISVENANFGITPASLLK